MKTFQYQINGHAVSIRLDDREGTIADLLVDGAHPEVSEERMPSYAAAIALALIEHEVEVVHDDETGIITFMPQESSWNHPSQLMNRL
ncbi:MAG: hypothetical protein ACI3X6_03885 [Alloprevotella sp.]